MPTDADKGAWLADLACSLNAGVAVQRYTIEMQGNSLIVNQVVHGLAHRYVFGDDFFATAEFQLVSRFNTEARALVGSGATVRRGERSKAVANFAEAYVWLTGEARRGLHVQRYKGLGEMNPEQLWETTLDPTVRRLVQVRVEDIVAADQMFTTLMGEDVEPRRDFIERHALLVGNLDV
jgi:DNA gyrase subunit B